MDFICFHHKSNYRGIKKSNTPFRENGMTAYVSYHYTNLKHKINIQPV